MEANGRPKERNTKEKVVKKGLGSDSGVPRAQDLCAFTEECTEDNSPLNDIRELPTAVGKQFLKSHRLLLTSQHPTRGICLPEAIAKCSPSPLPDAPAHSLDPTKPEEEHKSTQPFGVDSLFTSLGTSIPF